MTIEERIEFLQQSIESHDRQLGELVDRAAQTDRKIAELAAKTDRQIAELVAQTNLGFERMEKGFERTQLNFDRLTLAMIGLTEHRKLDLGGSHLREWDKLTVEDAQGNC